MSITLTETAADKIKRHMESENLAEGAVLRMGITGGGCAGLQYTLGFKTDFDPKQDEKYEHHGVAVVAQKKMALFLDGTTVDYQDGPTGSGFAIDNPTVPRGGGCPGCGGG